MKLVFLLGISLTANMLLVVLNCATYSCWRDEMEDNARLNKKVIELRKRLSKEQKNG